MLRVSAEHAGKPARCPTCNTVYTVPEAPDAAAAPVAPEAPICWRLQTPEGQVYGPVDRNTLNQWVAEGRISDDCQLRNDLDQEWQPAPDVFPVLRPVPKGVPLAATNDMGLGTLRGIAPADGYEANVRFVNSHRGVLVLALGILSWAIGCPVFGIMAWVMGSNDLRDMQRGTMDAGGLGLTRAGQIIGMIHAIVILAVIVVSLAVLLFAGVLR